MYLEDGANRMERSWYPLHTIQTPLLQKHCDLLAVLDQPLFHTIHQKQNDEELYVTKAGALVCCRTGGEPPEYVFGEPDAQQQLQELQTTLKRGMSASRFLVVLGGACGYALQPLTTWVHHNPDTYVLWMEPGYARVAAAMRFVDLCPALATGRLQVAVGAIDEQAVLDAVERFRLWEQPTPFIVNTIHKTHDAWIHTFSGSFASIAGQHQERLARIIAQKPSHNTETPSPIKKILLVDCWKNSAQHIHLNSIERALQTAGIEQKRVSIDGYRIDLPGYDHRRQAEWTLLQACEELQPDVILSYAYHAPHILRRERFEALGVPWLQVVSNLVFHDEGYYENEYVALCETGLLDEYRQRGARQIAHVPIMANYCVDEPPATDRSIPVLFVGNPLGLPPNEVNAFWKRIQQKTELTGYVKEALQVVGRFDNNTDLFAFLEENPVRQVENRNDSFLVYRFLLCQTTQMRRIELLESIAGLGLHVFGNWQHLPPDSPLRACVKGFMPIQKEPEIYPYVNVAVNIHSSGHVTSPNMRFFNSPGLGAVQITDGPFESFLSPQSETVYYRSVQEFREKVEYYLHHPQEADAIRQQALSRIQQEWTYTHFLQMVSKQTGIRFSNLSPE